LRQVSIDGREFVIGKLDPRRAFHVVRRLAPLVGSLRDFVPYMTGDEQFDPNDLDQITSLAEPLARALAEIPESDANYVIDTCLSVVHVKLIEQGGVLSPIMSGSHMMYDWITMPMMIRLVIQSVMENLQGFIPAGARAS
jgi:hypothetical protein